MFGGMGFGGATPMGSMAGPPLGSMAGGLPSFPGAGGYPGYQQPQYSARPRESARVARPASGGLPERNGVAHYEQQLALQSQSPRPVRALAADVLQTQTGPDPALAQLQAAIASKDKDIRDLRKQNDVIAAQYDRQIKEVRDALVAKTQQAARLESLRARSVGMKGDAAPKRRPAPAPPVRHQQPGLRASRTAGMTGVPTVAHIPLRGDEIDNRLADVYNQTNSAVQFRRINKGVYIYGTLQVEVAIINHKLMVKDDGGWNRGNFGPIEKFLHSNENAQREALRIPLDA